MASPIHAQVLLCDSAVADSGGAKVHMLGAGWSVTSSPTSPHAVVLFIKVPWDRANQPIKVTMNLLDSDGRPVQIRTPQGEQAVGVEATLEVGRPPGLPPGTPLDASFALNVGSLPIKPGRYEYRYSIAELEDSVSFTVRQR